MRGLTGHGNIKLQNKQVTVMEAGEWEKPPPLLFPIDSKHCRIICRISGEPLLYIGCIYSSGVLHLVKQKQKQLFLFLYNLTATTHTTLESKKQGVFNVLFSSSSHEWEYCKISWFDKNEKPKLACLFI